MKSSRRDLHNALLCTVLESNPQKRGKPWGEKNLVQPRENWPGEACKQPQPATQYYLRARSEESLRIRNKVLTGDFSSTPCERHTKIIGVRRQYNGFLFSGVLIYEFPFSDFLRCETPQRSSKLYVQASCTVLESNPKKRGSLISIFCLKFAKQLLFVFLNCC